MENDTKKSLVIIGGVTGAIGSAFLAQYARQDNTIVYGLSRKATKFREFVEPGTEKLPQKLLICSIDDALEDSQIDQFVEAIDYMNLNSIMYVHAIGYYPFEINDEGNYEIKGDHDKDGVCDEVMDLTYRRFVSTTRHLSSKCRANSIPMAGVIFGGIADKYEPTAHQSWCRTMTKTKQYMQQEAGVCLGMHLVNISSVICPHELITRPYVFTHTNANQSYWLTPDEVAKKFLEATKSTLTNGYHKHEFFHKMPSFNTSYYDDRNFTPTKVKELYGSGKGGKVHESEKSRKITAETELSNM